MHDDLILKIKSRLFQYPDARRIATANLGPDEMAAELSRVHKLLGIFDSLAEFSAWAGVLMGLLVAALYNWYAPIPPGLQLGTLVLVFGMTWVMTTGFTLLLCLWLTDNFASHAHRQALSPIAKTAACETALKALEEGGPNVAAWRNYAIARRSQLYGCDVLVMTCLRDLYVYEARQKAHAEEIERACALVHSVA